MRCTHIWSYDHALGLEREGGITLTYCDSYPRNCTLTLTLTPTPTLTLALD